MFTDFSRPSYDIKFKIKLEGQGITIQSQSYYFSGPVNVQPGIPLMMSGNDLSGLLNENHLDFSGITRAQYDARKVLPEGFYTITLTAYDFANPVPIQVSNEAVTQAWMVLNDPPFLNLPSCTSSVTPTTPQQITFFWTSMNLLALYSTAPTEFTFELWEIFPANQSPGNIIATTAPLYSNTTTLTMISYGITEPPLVVGRTYVWRVTAHDPGNREYFRNNGISQWCTFTYGDNFDLLGNSAQLTLHAQALTYRMARCWWDSLSIYNSYNFQFRKVGTLNWFSSNTQHAAIRIPDLEPNTDYEAEVTGTSSDGNGPVSNLVTWHTPQQTILNCGESSAPPAQQNFHPLTQANTGMIWQIGQFEMNVTSLNNTSSGGGWYSGLAKVVLPFGFTLNCTFSGIQVGDDHIVYSGEVKAISEGMTQWMEQYTLAHLMEFIDTTITSSIDTVIVNGDLITIQTNDGQFQISSDDRPYVIQDGNGTTYIINADGSVTIQQLVPHIPLTDQQILIYKLALQKLRDENSTQLITQKQNELEHARTDYSNYLQNNIGIDLSTSSGTVPENVAFTAMTVDTTAASGISPKESAVKNAEYDFFRAKVCLAFAKTNPTTADLDLLANYLFTDNLASYLYIAEQIAAGTNNDTIGEAVKNSMYVFIDGMLHSQVFIQPVIK
ncbi:MAG: fibronectin type III domain-containing protein [Bacteroidetes bacterium]|nr:fibronectin type III domain-containing protein [Bacteroidota bacterium]